jgi:SAM-dependent methyltransferase
MSTTIESADQALKAKHRAMWALGDYPIVAAEVIPDLGAVVVEACGVRAGQRVLDVAAGSGNAAIPAALAGASVVAADLTPEMFEAGRRAAADRGASVQWQEADAENLPFADGEFDVVLSCVGAMFAPHHQRVADEMLRVCRPGGTIGLISWTPGGFVGQMFAVMKPYVAPPPAGAQPAPLWGDESHVRGLFGERITDVAARAQDAPVDRFGSPEEFPEYFKRYYGPTTAAYRGLADQPERAAELDRELAALARQHGAGARPMGWEYLLFTARKR